MFIQDSNRLIELQVKILYQRKTRSSENVAAVLFGPESDALEEEGILNAVNGKYDALRQKLLLEALVNQVSCTASCNLCLIY